MKQAPIRWFVWPEGEGAPFQREQPGGDDFLTHYTWPEDDAGEPLQWTRLDVMDKLWSPGKSDKGGFIQQLTGWKPSPFQSTVDLEVLAAAANVYFPGSGT